MHFQETINIMTYLFLQTLDTQNLFQKNVSNSSLKIYYYSLLKNTFWNYEHRNNISDFKLIWFLKIMHN